MTLDERADGRRVGLEVKVQLPRRSAFRLRGIPHPPGQVHVLMGLEAGKDEVIGAVGFTRQWPNVCSDQR